MCQNAKSALNDDEDSSCAALPAAVYCRMAIYHSHMSYTSRSGGGSACSHAAYISGGIVKDERTGMTWDYSKKAHDVLYSEIIAHEDAPSWVYDRDQLWNEVEQFEDYIAEKRFKGHKDPEKNTKSLAGKEKFLSSCKTSFKADFALPLEITNKEHLIELARKIVKECYVDHGLVAQYAIHDMKGNPHLHVIATTRPLIDGSFSEKRFVIDKVKLVEMRKQMADITNQFGQEKGYDYHLDHRSYKDQGIKLIATKHLGPNARHRLQELSQNVQDNEEVRQKNIEILLEHPEEIIKVVASQKAVFTQVDLAKEIFKRVGGDEKLYTVLKAKVDGLEIPSIAIIGKTLNDNHIYESKSIHFDKAEYSRTIESFTAKLLSQEHAIYLGENVKGQVFYTSKEMKMLETTLHETLEVLKTKESFSIKENHKLNSIEQVQKQEGIIFSEEQLGAIDHLLSNKAITVLTGKAGTGKSTVLKPVVEAYKKSGFTVIGAAFQGKVADQLSNELSIEGYTLDQLNNRWSAQEKFKNLIENKELKGQALAKAKSEVEWLQEWRLTDKHVVILDEGSMVHGSLWNSLLQEVVRSGARLRIVQDNKQIKALHGLDAARLVEEKVGAYEIKGVVRQKEHWMREASALLNEHRIEEGLKPYYERGHFDFRERDFEAKISLIADYLEGIAQTPHQTHMALAQKNKDVVELNEFLRGALMSQGKLGDEFIFGREGEGILNTHHPLQGPKTQHFRKSAYGRRFAIGDRVMFLSNDHKERHVQTLEKGSNERQGVKNGTLGVIESFDLKRQTVEVRLHDSRLVGFDSKAYDALTHGYAVTINKSQGATFDHSYGFFSSFNSNQLLIWLTRHKENFKGYVSKGIASDLKGMVSHVARSDYKGLSTDYDLSEYQKPYFNLVQHYWGISREAGNLLTQIESITQQAEKQGKEASLTPQWKQYQELTKARNQGAKEILENWSACSPYIHQTGVRRETLEVQAGLRKRLLSVAEEAALDKVENYFSVSSQTRNIWKEISKTHPGSLSYNHPDYETYTKLKTDRDEIAYEMTSFPMLYKSFFKVKEQDGSYATYWGGIYNERPQSFKAVQIQAEQYIKQKRSEAYENTLNFEERASYKQAQEYKSLHHQGVALSHYLKEVRNTVVLSHSVENQKLKHQEIVCKRDKLAYQLVSNYSSMQPFIEKLGLKEEILLKHAVLGEVRGMIESYKEAKVIEERTQLADKLVSFTLGEQGSVDKGLYSLLKEQSLDLQKLKFEQGWFKAHLEDKDLSIKNIDELVKAYKDLSSYREDKKALAHWDTLGTKGIDPSSKEATVYNNRLQKGQNEYQAFERIKAQAANTYDREEVLACLSRSHIEGIFARHIEGWVSVPKAVFKNNEIRYGQDDEFWIDRKSNNGRWYNHAATEGGDIFNYVSQSLNITYGEAIKQIGEEINAPQITHINWEERAQREINLKLQAELEEKAKVAEGQKTTQKLYKISRPIQGTLAEKYLREHRQIKTAELPESLRFIPQYKDSGTQKLYPALAAFARDASGGLSSVQLTYLDPLTANKADVAVKKKSRGSIKGTAVEIQSGEGPTYIAEGIETALSLKEVQIKGRILVSLGLSNMRNVGNHIKDKEAPVILCCDADDPQSGAWNSSKQALEKLNQEGFKVSIIRPQGENGRDFNDVLKEENIEAVRAYFKEDKAFTGAKSKKPALESETPRSWNEPSQDSSLTSQEEVLVNNEASKGCQSQELKSLEAKIALSSDWQEEFKQEYLRKNPEAALQKTFIPEKAPESLTSHEVIHKYKSLTWRLENVSSGSILKDAQKEFKELISTVSQDKALMRKILLEDKQIAKEITTTAEQQDKTLKRGPAFER